MPRRTNGESEGLYRDENDAGVLSMDGPAPEDMYAPDVFADDDDLDGANGVGSVSNKSPIIVRRRTYPCYDERFGIWALHASSY
jgi:hypothetical protein